MNLSYCLFLTTFLASLATTLHAKDAPYIASDEYATRQMLKLVDVGPNDLVYDLGSGQGHILILAAKEKYARGVGIEIDPELVAKAKHNAREAGVADMVTFVE